MCRGLDMRIRSWMMAWLLCAPFAVSAQSFGGSFGEDAGAAVSGSFDTVTTTPDVSAPDDGFGGSFGGGTQPAPAVTNPAPVEADDGFGGGSFEPIQPAPEVVTPQPADPAPAVPAPQYQPTDPQVFAFESRDFGVPPTSTLRNGPMHAATPTAIPGGQVVSTEGLSSALNQGMQIVLIDVLGGQYTLPSAIVAPGLAQPGSFQDRTQQQAAQWLQQVTGGNPDIPVVVFCSDPQCWLSYNAALRVINAGYRQVYWYRGGLQAWQMAALPLQPASF